MGMHIKHFYAPTPKKWRQIGDALLGTADRKSTRLNSSH